MRILFYSHYFPPEVNAPATRVYDHCTRWARAGHDVTVVTCAPNCPDGKVYPGYRNRWRPQTEIIDGVRVIRVWTVVAPNAGVLPRFINFSSYLLSAVAWTLFLRRHDVVVATTPQFFCAWAGIIVAKLRGMPVVLDVRDIVPELIIRVGAMRRGLSVRLLAYLERLMYRAADAVVTVTKGCCDHILPLLSKGKDVTLITNGVNPQFFVPRSPSPAVREKWAGRDQVVCSYVGTIGLGYDFETVLNAADLARREGRSDIVFWMVGDGSKREMLESTATARQLQSHVRFFGRQDRAATREIIAASDCMLIPYKDHPFFRGKLPFKMFEFMAMEKPVVLAGNGEAADVVRQAVAGMVIKAGDPRGLLDAVDALTRSPERHFSPKAARDYVLEHYDVNRLAVRYLDLLNDVVAARVQASRARAPVQA